jgi:type II secretory pathway component PulK
VAKENAQLLSVLHRRFLKGAKVKPKHAQQNGFVLLVIIMLLAVIGVLMYMLTEDTKTLSFQSDTAYLKALERNLTASGLVWAKNKIKNQDQQVFNKIVELDVNDMNLRSATLNVTIIAPMDTQPQVQINTSCSRGRRTLSREGKYLIKP